MPARALSGTQRLILLCALALGVILMHHVNAPGAMSDTVAIEHVEPSPIAGSSAPHHVCPPCGAHVMTHVCLAVLDGTTLTLLVLLVFLGFAAGHHEGAAGSRGSPLPGRPPGRAVLTSLCVLRV